MNIYKSRKNGKVKEYHDKELIFEGKYLNNKRWNGKSQKYDSNDKLVFEGEYINGEKKGLIKEYYENTRKLTFEGECINCEKKGIIRKYDSLGNLIFEGEIRKGERNGKGKEYKLTTENENILIFEFEYLNNKRWNGKGRENDENKNFIFEGEYIN